MARLQPVRGTHDILPDQMRRHRNVVDVARNVVGLYGFEEVATPIFEFTQVFSRTLGDTSDIVTKEMYSFEDRNGDHLTLRPENTAGVARSFISEGLAQQIPLKYFYAGPMFRRERPQKGRLRQFHQVGIELIGVASPAADIDVIAAGYRVLTDLGLREQVTLELNTLGDPESRENYRNALIAYLTPHRSNLSAESQERFRRNPLRILDSKNEVDQEIVADAPEFASFLTEESRLFFDNVKEGLERIGVPYKLNSRLVRGLDYYGHTAFEFTTSALGAQGTVLAGGRYDGLIKLMGGPPTPGIGWAAGIERLAMLVEADLAKQPIVALAPLGDLATEKVQQLAELLRGSGFVVDVGYSGNLSRRMKRADKLNAAVIVIIGDDELARGVAQIRNMETGEQSEIALDELTTGLAQYR
ncbi:MAG: histidine--tRNA ligase [Rhodospirillaceae bacterium]|nr:histidine--tRNA ligase [Rhodospirillaceae bacterium]